MEAYMKRSLLLFTSLLLVFNLSVFTSCENSQKSKTVESSEERMGEQPAGDYVKSSSYAYKDDNGYSFSNSRDVIIYLSSRTFRSGSYSLKVRTDGMYINGRCLTYAPVVRSFDGEMAVVQANAPNNGFVIFYVDANAGTLTERSSGQVYYLE